MRTEANAWPEVARRQDLWTRVVLAATFAAMNLACPAAPPRADAGAAQLQFCVDQARALTDQRVRCGDTLAATGEDMNASGHPGCAGNVRLRFDPSAASLCLSSLQASCSPVQSESCLSANTGTVGLGDACFDGECATGLYCETGSACPGQCVPLIAIGQPALGPCVEGALSWNGLCARARAVGDSCALPDGSAERPPCANGATCGPSELCVERTWAGAAEYCDEFGFGCDLGLQCRGDPGRRFAVAAAAAGYAPGGSPDDCGCVAALRPVPTWRCRLRPRTESAAPAGRRLVDRLVYGVTIKQKSAKSHAYQMAEIQRPAKPHANLIGDP